MTNPEALPTSPPLTLEAALEQVSAAGLQVYIIYGPDLRNHRWDVRLEEKRVRDGIIRSKIYKKGEAKTLPEALIAALSYQEPTYQAHTSRPTAPLSKMEDLI